MVSAPLLDMFSSPRPAAPLALLSFPTRRSSDLGTSLVPLMVTVTSWLLVPSEDTAVKLSVSDCPAPSCWIAAWVLDGVSTRLNSRAQIKLYAAFLLEELACAVKLDWP